MVFTNKSLKRRAAKVSKKADFLFVKKAPPNKAMAATGVKLGICGNNLLKATNIIANTATIVFPDILVVIRFIEIIIMAKNNINYEIENLKIYFFTHSQLLIIFFSFL